MTYYKGIKLVGNGFLLLCILSFLLSAGTAIYLSNQNKLVPKSNTTIPSSDVTGSWKSITNDTVGITFKYPNSLLPYSMPMSQTSTIFSFDARTNQFRDHRALLDSDLELEIVVYKPFVGSIASYLTAINAKDGSNITQPYPGLTGLYTKVKTLMIDKAQATVIYSEPVREYSEYDGIIVQNNKNVALFRLMTGSHTRREELLHLLDQVLSTFKFTN